MTSTYLKKNKKMSTLQQTQADNIFSVTDKNSQELLRIYNNGDIYYRKDNQMVKVNIPEEISEAFLMTILGYTGNNPEEIIVEKISQHKCSDEYFNKMEKAFRKYKLQKLQKLNK